MSEFSAERWNRYFYPGTDVLVNHADLRSQTELEVFESRLVGARQAQLAPMTPGAQFNLAHLQAIHKHLFQDVYAWAGELRDVPIAKGRSAFDPPDLVEQKAAQIHDKLAAKDFLRGRDKEHFVEGFSELFADLNRLHPFREGNGRTTRAMLSEVALRAGYSLDERRLEEDRYAWNAASSVCVRGDLKPIREIFHEALRPSRSVAFEQLERPQALSLHPELQPVYDKLDASAKSLATQHPGNERAQAHFLKHQQQEVVRQLDSGTTRGLAMEKARAPGSRLDLAWEKAIAYANQTMPDPKTREAFLGQFQARMRSAERQTATPASRQPPKELQR